MPFGIKVSKPGIDVLTATDPKDFTLHSGYNTLKIAEEGYGTGTITSAGSSVDKVVTHNLGYKPQWRAFGYQPDTDRWYMLPVVVNAGAPLWNMLGSFKHTDVNTMTLSLWAAVNPPAVDKEVKYKYYIFEEPEVGAWYE